MGDGWYTKRPLKKTLSPRGYGFLGSLNVGTSFWSQVYTALDPWYRWCLRGCAMMLHPALPPFSLNHFVNGPQRWIPSSVIEYFLCDTAFLSHRACLHVAGWQSTVTGTATSGHCGPETRYCVSGFGVASPRHTNPPLCT